MYTYRGMLGVHSSGAGRQEYVAFTASMNLAPPGW